MAFRVIRPDQLEWVEREPEPGGVPRHVARLSDVLEFAHTRGSLWRYPPGAKGRRHRDLIQEETFVVLEGTLTMYLGDPPERVDVGPHGVVAVEPMTPLQIRNEGEEELVLFIYGAPPVDEGADFFDDAELPA